MSELINDRYKIIKHIGQGGMADVYVAYDNILKRDVAIKVLREDLNNDPVSVMRFKREASASTSLSHPNIVDIYDVGEFRDHYYIVMEYIKGHTLKEVITKRGALMVDEAIAIMKQLVSATLEAHRRGIIHRDIKPQNVLVKADGSVKMVDFGIALASGSMQLTQSDSIMGSVHYLAPELAKGEQASEQSDIYSLGIVFYELLSGDVPFKANQAVQVALMHMKNKMPNVKDINPSVPQSVENIILRATSKDKAFRYKNCEEMLLDLNTALDADRINESRNVFNEFSIDKTSTTNIKTKKKKRLKPAVIIVPLLTIFLIGIIVSFLYFFGFFAPKITTVVVPSVIGLDITEAKQLLEENSLVLDVDNIEYELTDNIEKGKIISMDPVDDTEVEKGKVINVKVSSGIAVKIDNYVGKNINEVKKELEKYPNLKIELVEEESEDYKGGTIMRQELLEAGSRFNQDVVTNIRLVYSAYKTIIIPSNIIGMKIDDATKLLKNMGAEVMLSVLDTSNLSEESKKELDYGVVIQTNPAANTSYKQEDGSNVVLYYY